MKHTFSSLLLKGLIGIIVYAGCSCSVEKRLYSSGYHIETHRNQFRSTSTDVVANQQIHKPHSHNDDLLDTSAYIIPQAESNAVYLEASIAPATPDKKSNLIDAQVQQTIKFVTQHAPTETENKQCPSLLLDSSEKSVIPIIVSLALLLVSIGLLFTPFMGVGLMLLMPALIISFVQLGRHDARTNTYEPQTIVRKQKLDTASVTSNAPSIEYTTDSLPENAEQAPTHVEKTPEANNTPGKQESEYDSNAIASLVLGIVSIFGVSPLFMIGIPSAILAIVFGSRAKKRLAQSNKKGHKMAKAGTVLGILSLVLMTLAVVIFAIIFIAFLSLI